MRSEEKYRALFENNLDCIFIYDTDTNEILDFNRAALNLYGYTSDELIGQNILILSADLDASKKGMRELKEEIRFQHEHRYLLQWPFYRPAGRWRHPVWPVRWT